MAKMKNIDLDEVRKFFPDWPSDFEIAKAPGNWVQKFVEFSDAGRVLIQEYQQGKIDFQNNVGKPIDGNALIRTRILPVALYCYSFSIELLIKAALVNQGKLEEMQPGERLPFASHKLEYLAAEILEIELSPPEIEFLEQATHLIITEKYPTNRRPSVDESSLSVISDVQQFLQTYGIIKGKIFKVATAKHDD